MFSMVEKKKREKVFKSVAFRYGKRDVYAIVGHWKKIKRKREREK